MKNGITNAQALDPIFDSDSSAVTSKLLCRQTDRQTLVFLFYILFTLADVRYRPLHFPSALAWTGGGSLTMVDKEPLGLLLCEGGLGSEQGQARARARQESDPRGREKRRGKEGGGGRGGARPSLAR